MFVLALAAVLGLLGAPRADAQDAGSAESEFLRLVNQERASRGLRTLASKPDLVAVARNQATRMAQRGEPFHNPSLGSEVDNWRKVGENVGAGYEVGSLHRSFMESATHRQNILDAEFDHVGIGVVVSGGKLFVSQVFRDPMQTQAAPPPPPPPTTVTPPPPPPTTAPPAPTTTSTTAAPAPTTTVLTPVLIELPPVTEAPKVLGNVLRLGSESDEVAAPAVLAPQDGAEPLPDLAWAAGALVIAVLAMQLRLVRRLGLV